MGEGQNGRMPAKTPAGGRKSRKTAEERKQNDMSDKPRQHHRLPRAEKRAVNELRAIADADAMDHASHRSTMDILQPGLSARHPSRAAQAPVFLAA